VEGTIEVDEPVAQGKGKKQSNKEKGVEARNSIQAMRDTSVFGKRKADIHTSPKKQSVGSLLTNLDNG
jgi:hypothetical protein